MLKRDSNMKLLQALLGVALMAVIVCIENFQIDPKYKTLFSGLLILAVVMIIYRKRIKNEELDKRSSYLYVLVILTILLTLLTNFFFIEVGILPLALLWISVFFLGEFLSTLRQR